MIVLFRLSKQYRKTQVDHNDNNMVWLHRELPLCHYCYDNMFWGKFLALLLLTTVHLCASGTPTECRIKLHGYWSYTFANITQFKLICISSVVKRVSAKEIRANLQYDLGSSRFFSHTKCTQQLYEPGCTY